MSKLSSLTVCEVVDLLEKGKFSSVELVEDLLSSIDARDAEIGAYVHLDREDALRQARAADVRRQAGEKAPLLGVPVAVKDAISVAGQPCGAASRIMEGYIAPHDATAVARLRSAGAVFVGRANMDELSMGSTTEHSAIKITRNPWDLTKIPGGSSGGSAAMLAADEAIASLGSDTGGSVRLPAAFCGCVGIKPSYGRVSRLGLAAYASSLDQIGPLAKTVADAALLLSIMGGVDPLDSTSAEIPMPDLTQALSSDLKGLKLGLPRQYFEAGLEAENAEILQTAVRKCEQLGAKIIEVDLKMTGYAAAAYRVIASAEACSNLARLDGVRYGRRAAVADDLSEMYLKTRSEGFGREVKQRILFGTYVLTDANYKNFYLRALKTRRLVVEDFNEAFKLCDALLAPVAKTAAYALGQKQAKTTEPPEPPVSFCSPSNLAGNCALSVPCGFTKSGLPIGLQVIAPPFKEDTILRVAYAYEQASSWRKTKPNFCV